MTRFSALLLSTVVAIGLGTAISTPSHAQDKDKKAKGKLVFEIYKDASEGFRWRLKSANGQIIGTSGAGYKDKVDCKHGIELIKAGASKAEVKDSSAEDK